MVNDLDKNSAHTMLTIEHSPNTFGTKIEDTKRKPKDSHRKRSVSREGRDKDKANDAASQAIADYQKAKAKRIEKAKKSEK